jgi:DNA polymerase-3 subunit epsilon
VDASRREKHGALLDAYLLAEVYAELMGGRQTAMSLSVERKVNAQSNLELLRQRPAPLASRLTAQEDEAHRAFASGLGKAPIWKRYCAQEEN